MHSGAQLSKVAIELYYKLLSSLCAIELKLLTCVGFIFVNMAHRIKNSTVFDSFREVTSYECTDSFNFKYFKSFDNF